MRDKEAEDVRRAKTWSQYAIKFNSFIQWKQLIKRVKVTKERGVRLEGKTARSRLNEVFAQIKEKIGNLFVI